MSLDVCLHFLLVLERLIADGAFVALGSIVLHPMQFQDMIIAKVTETDVTMIRFLARVRTRVYLQLFGACESLAATGFGTLVGLLARMGAHVNHQLTRLYKCLLTDGTLVRTLARMDAHMTMQFAGMLKGASTHITLVGTLLGMDATMHLQILLDAEQFVTELTLEGTLARVCAIVTDLWMEKNICFSCCSQSPSGSLLLTSLAGTANVFWHTLH